MKNKFGKNDKLIFHATVSADVIACIYAVIGLLYGIVTIVNGALIESMETVLIGIFVILLVFIIVFVSWVFIKIFINMCCDIKLIRNKLYSIDNYYLNKMVAEKQSNIEMQANGIQDELNADLSQQNIQLANKIQQLKALKELLDSDIISDSEFEREKQKILSIENEQ